jgi:hypothetical protein
MVSTFNPKPATKPVAAPAPIVSAPAPKSKKGGRKMIDNLSLTWEPIWPKVLHELGITRP